MNGIELKTYGIANQYAGQPPRDTGVRTSPLRGIGFTANKFVAESFLDEVALERGADLVQFRLELLKNSPRAQKVLQHVADMADWARKRDNTALGVAFVDYSNTLMGAVAEVVVDRSSGQISVKNFWCAADCGIAVQPDSVIAQYEGGIVYGLGLALTEEISIDDGIVQQSNFYDYTVMRMSDTPNIYVELIASNEYPSGVGQMPVTVVAPAVGNAVARLTGVRLRESGYSYSAVREAANITWDEHSLDQFLANPGAV